MEEERIAKTLDKRISRESLEREKLYILSLHNTKKETDDIPLSNSSNSGLKIVLFQLLGSVRNLFGGSQVTSMKEAYLLVNIVIFVLLSELQIIQR